MVDNGCIQCAELGGSDELCIDCQIEQADADVNRAMNTLEKLKREKQLLEELKQKHKFK